ncbi:unnamed protein product [Protopolystoma xenopodis]|uniref:Uncharacterized protein n=1 Tax=Protopolystoma xenopodis TaxID=117903 RepID=A0A448XCG4_9PLAT|nr:unnamed protein product [Protopolystoma xenopodis]
MGPPRSHLLRPHYQQSCPPHLPSHHAPWRRVASDETEAAKLERLVTRSTLRQASLLKAVKTRASNCISYTSFMYCHECACLPSSVVVPLCVDMGMTSAVGVSCRRPPDDCGGGKSRPH